LKIGTKEYNIFKKKKTLDQAIDFIATKLKFRGIVYQLNVTDFLYRKKASNK